MERYLKPITKPCIKKISEQMENYLYSINKKNGNSEIGYFIRIKDKNGKNYIILVTNSNVLEYIDNNSLKITIDNEPKLIELGDIRYEDKKYKKAVIEIKNSNDIKYIFEIDDNLNKSELEMNMNYNKESIYIIINFKKIFNIMIIYYFNYSFIIFFIFISNIS